MKKLLAILVVLSSGFVHAATPKSGPKTVVFTNNDTEKVMVTIREKDSGVKVEERSLQSQASFEFKPAENTDYAVNAAETKDKDGLRTGYFNFRVRHGYDRGELAIERTKGLFGSVLNRAEKLTFRGTNVEARQPMFKNKWEKPSKKAVLK